MATFVALTNELLRRINEVTLDTAGDGFTTVRNVQALAKDSINNSIRNILQKGQEFPFLKTTQTQTLVAGTRQYDFPADYSRADWQTFYLKKLTSVDNTPMHLPSISYEEYIQKFRHFDDTGNQSGISSPTLVYQTDELKFGLTPITDNVYEVEYVYYKFPSDLSAFNDTSVVPDRFNHVVIDGAMMYMMRFRSNEQSAAIHQNNFEDGIKSMRRILVDEPLRVRSTVVDRINSSNQVLGRVL
tara:strand:- start:3364 stop:4092 length:729 start_codon:yes stop_codon:yes gene_type:complete